MQDDNQSRPFDNDDPAFSDPPMAEIAEDEPVVVELRRDDYADEPVQAVEDYSEPGGLIEGTPAPEDFDGEQVGLGHTRRDAETGFLIGGFVLLMALPVLIATVFIRGDEQATMVDPGRAIVVNLAAGGVLVLVGAGFIARAWWVFRKFVR
ncbi:MAG: hypothetical protein AAB353_05085 [Candidatus Hydrogenedentota bacterium]